MSSSPAASSSSPDPLNNRVDFKLHAAKMQLGNLKQIEARAGSLMANKVRIKAEMEIDEILYYLVGVKDALLQEINSEFQLGLALKDVASDKINLRQIQKCGAIAAKDIMSEINGMECKTRDPLWLINELHNHSKHRNMIPKAFVGIAGRGIIKVSFRSPRTKRKMKRPIIDYLDASYKRIENLQKNVTNKISQYRV
jgi:hypothetical protein